MLRSSSVRRILGVCAVAPWLAGHSVSAQEAAGCSRPGCFEATANGAVSATFTGQSWYKVSPAGELLLVLARLLDTAS